MVDMIPCRSIPEGVSSMFSVAETSKTPASLSVIADLIRIAPEGIARWLEEETNP
ncbi:hypothetical protein GCM10027079_22970 [Sediminivirga luteola]|uniref:Uncharacterized protein n=1 Tax=Sediminivirga luteola TaxID=1774748 RepID=A0A8J2U1A7_9MICO|nr:hypothetical protein GCM10011333_34620 [Sediminivirga luteola]